MFVIWVDCGSSGSCKYSVVVFDNSGSSIAPKTNSDGSVLPCTCYGGTRNSNSNKVTFAKIIEVLCPDRKSYFSNIQYTCIYDILFCFGKMLAISFINLFQKQNKK